MGRRQKKDRRAGKKYATTWSRNHITDYIQDQVTTKQKNHNTNPIQNPPGSPGSGTDGTRQHDEITSDQIGQWIEDAPHLGKEAKCVVTSCQLVEYTGTDAEMVMAGVHFVTNWG